MTRQIFADENSRLGYRLVDGTFFSIPEGTFVDLYLDEAKTQLADVRHFDGSAVTRINPIVFDDFSLLSLFQGPDDARTVLYASVWGGPATPIYSRGMVLPLAPFSRPGTLALAPGVAGYPVPFACTLFGVRLTANTSPTGAPILVDVNRNGSTVFTTQANRPTIVAGSHSGGPGLSPDVVTLNPGDIITIDIDQVGSSVPGSDLVVVPLIVQV